MTTFFQFYKIDHCIGFTSDFFSEIFEQINVQAQTNKWTIVQHQVLMDRNRIFGVSVLFSTID